MSRRLRRFFTRPRGCRLRIALAARLAPAFLVLALAAGAATAANLVGDMRVVGDATRTRFVVDLQKNPDFGVLRLVNPERIVIDLPDVEFKGPARPGPGRGLVSDFRYGLIAPGKARIVLDLAQPVEIVNSFVLDPVGAEPARLVVDMAPASAEDFAKAAAADRDRADAAAGRTEQSPGARSDRPVVVIDPGHGGIDSGAVGADGMLEKEVTLKFGRELARRLKAGGEVEPVMTRDDDRFLSLSDRVLVAQEHKAVLFISVHADTVKENFVRGATVYTLSDEASDALAAALAARENRADVLAGLELEDQPQEVADILFDLTRRETRNLSIRFGKLLVNDMTGEFTFNANPLRRASFRVLKAPEVPSVLLELGYLSNEEDEKLFRAGDWPVGEAAAVARAVETFVAREAAGRR